MWISRLVLGVVVALVVTACGPAGDSVESVGPSATTMGTAPSASVEIDVPSPVAPSATALASPSGPGHFEGLVDIGGRSLFLECDGAGAPTLILDAGLSGDSGNWGRVGFLPLLTPISRWCVYDRANRGRSDPDPRMRTSADIVDDLKALLDSANLEPPYVLVGHSFGGYNVRLFASEFPDEVAGMVLMDTVTPGFVVGQEALLTPDQWAVEADSYRGRTEPYVDFLASGIEVAEAEPPPDRLPVLVVAATERHAGNVSWPAEWPGAKLDRLWDQEQSALAKLTPNTTLVVAEDTAHRIHVQRPEFMADLIATFMADVRSRK